MGHVVSSMVRETGTPNTTVSFSLAGVAIPGRTFASAMASGDTCYYRANHGTANEWEIGLGTFQTSGTLLLRTTILESSNSNAAVTFTAGTLTIELVMPATQILQLPLPHVLPNTYTLSPGYAQDVARYLRIPSGMTLTLGLDSTLRVH